MKTIILGSGIAGLGAWYADNSAEIYEASGKADCLLSTTKQDVPLITD